MTDRADDLQPAGPAPGGDAVPPSSPLAERIRDRRARVGVIGLGYVGLPTMAASAAAGFQVTGIDIDPARVAQVNAGHSYIDDLASDVLAPLVETQKVSATTDYAAVADMDVIVICVPTPVSKYREPELGPLLETVSSLAENMHGEQLVILQSTSFPGTTEEMVLPQLQRAGRLAGRDFYLAFSPERIDPGNPEYFIHNIPKVVGGVTPRCTEVASEFLSSIVERVIQVSSPKIAEMTKLLENIFRSVNIALVNELSQVCHRMDIDIWEVVRAASTKPFGFMPFHPGIGVGGHCIPVDPFYLSWKAKEYDFYVNFIELAARTNDNMPYYAVSRIVDILGDRGRALKGARLLLLGVTFKRDIGDSRNSPALRVAELLQNRHATIEYSDRHAPEISLGGCLLKSVELSEATLQRQDATIILVDHSYYDLETIVRKSKLAIDARDATRSLGPRPTVVRL